MTKPDYMRTREVWVTWKQFRDLKVGEDFEWDSMSYTKKSATAAVTRGTALEVEIPIGMREWVVQRSLKPDPDKFTERQRKALLKALREVVWEHGGTREGFDNRIVDGAEEILARPKYSPLQEKVREWLKQKYGWYVEPDATRQFHDVMDALQGVVEMPSADMVWQRFRNHDGCCSMYPSDRDGEVVIINQKQLDKALHNL